MNWIWGSDKIPLRRLVDRDTPWRFVKDKLLPLAREFLYDELRRLAPSCYTELGTDGDLVLMRGRGDWDVEYKLTCDKTGSIASLEETVCSFRARFRVGTKCTESALDFRWEDGSFEDMYDIDIKAAWALVAPGCEVDENSGFQEEVDI